jgi:FKBP-type peptidyl-prolyl cis-trans isomerase SlyD
VSTLDTQNKPNEVADDVVVSIDYTLTVDGQVIDSTEGDEPLQFLQGHQNIIPGLENELTGMKIGQSKTVTVPATEAYGEIDPDNIVDVPRSEFPQEIPLETGIELEVKNADGEVLTATIADVDGESVKLDFNHPLAGKELTFNVTVVDLRVPTEEEMAHGHVHVDDYDEDEEFEDDDEEFEDLLDEDLEEDLEYEDLDEAVDDEDEGSSGLDQRDSNARPR